MSTARNILGSTSGGHRRFPGIKGKRPDRKEQRRADAIARAPENKKHLYMLRAVPS